MFNFLPLTAAVWAVLFGLFPASVHPFVHRLNEAKELSTVFGGARSARSQFSLSKVTEIARGGNTAISSLALSVDQSKVQHLIFELSKEEVRALQTYSEECASWKEGAAQPEFAYPDLAKKIKEVYDENGVVLVRGLIDDTLLENLIEAGLHVLQNEKMTFNVDSFKSIKFGPVFGGPTVEIPGATPTDEDILLTSFRSVALKSPVSSCIGALLLDLGSHYGSVDESSNLRLLNDVFLAKGGNDESYCGWHIDDAVFWPCSPRHSPPGVNAWISMDDIAAKYGGAMAVIPKSHKAEWSAEAQQAIGHTITHPPEGFANPGELFQTLSKTCEIATISPKLNDRMEQEGILFDFQKGDVLMMNRFTWHRSVQVTPEGKKHFANKQEDNDSSEIVLKRYTIRYEVGSTPLIQGAAIHPSILYDASNSGKKIDDVVASSGPFFPKCWPAVSKSEMLQLPEMVDVKLPKAQENREAMMAKLRPPTK
jgi:ectoine hydroxylase-related dioxygenase (phytanoyl-CoA dioxygenase family)